MPNSIEKTNYFTPEHTGVFHPLLRQWRALNKWREVITKQTVLTRSSVIITINYILCVIMRKAFQFMAEDKQRSFLFNISINIQTKNLDSGLLLSGYTVPRLL